MTDKNKDSSEYRLCVGIALFNKENKVFVGERLDNPGAWQMPQGGIDKGEDIAEAFYREMREETGTDKADIIKIIEDPFRYELPDHLIGKLWNGKYIGQEQYWVAARFTGDDKDINIYAHHFPEFGQWRWVTPSELLKMIVPFKRKTYEDVFATLAEHLS